MLISFSIENWQSFREKTLFSMVAGKEKQHDQRIAEIDKYRMALLPTAVIYGANASGKTKFFNALQFVKNFVATITQPEEVIPREYFKLDKSCAEKPSKFNLELLIDDVCYEFSFSVSDEKVIEEKLVKILPSTEKVIYHREAGKKILFPDAPDLQKDNRLLFVAEGTRSNLLFLTNATSQNINYFQSIYDWFAHVLVLIKPDSRFTGAVDFLPPKDVFAKLDTGIDRLVEEVVPIEGVPEQVKMRLAARLAEGEQCKVYISATKSVLVTKKNGILCAKNLIPYHKSFEGEDIPFDVKEESAGTMRMLDLLPVFYDLLNPGTSKVYFIDELDRCLHTLLTKNLLETYLQSCSNKTRSQLIFTTHDVLLMEQSLFRRDEIWVAERNQKGCSTLISFSEYKGIRSDKDIRKSYLQGRLGGVPKISL